MDFEAVVLCGDGHRLSPIAGGTVPKALLPVANVPLVQHVLDWCKRARFHKVYLGCTTSCAHEIREYVEATGANAEVVHGNGSAIDLIATIGPKLQREFVILPCDFISDLDPEKLLRAHRSSDSSTLVSGFYYKNEIETIDTRKALNPDVLLHTPFDAHDAARLLDSYARQSVKDNKRLDVRMSMLWKFANASVSTALLSTGIYVCRTEVLNLLQSNRSVHKMARDLARRTWKHGKVKEDVAMYMVKVSFIRANNLPAYLEANRTVMRRRARQAPNPVAPKDKGAAKIGNDSLVGENTTVGDRTSVKRTVVGQNCIIGAKCRLTGCVVLDSVNIENEVVLDNCIIGQGAVIHAKAHLTSCEIEGGYQIAAGHEAKNEVFKGLSMSKLGEDYENLYSSLSDEDDDEEDDEDDEEDDYEEEDEGDYGDDDVFDRS